MAFIHHDGVPTGRQRRKKTARERRDQRTRAFARAFQTVASALSNVASHRGGKLGHVGVEWHGHILAPRASSVPMPIFRGRHFAADAAVSPAGACRKTALQSDSIVQLQLLRGIEGEELASQGSVDEDDSCNLDASQASDGEGSDVQPVSFAAADSVESQSEDPEPDDSDESQQNSSMSRACRKAASHTSACGNGRTPPDDTAEAGGESSDSASEEEKVEVGSNNASGSRCIFSIGDVIRPIHRLAELEAYRSGAICQVVGSDEDGDPIVSYYEANGELSLHSCSVYATHFEKVCDIALFEEHPQISHSSWESVLNSNRRN